MIFTFCAKTYLSNVCEKIEKLLNIALKQFETPMATSDHPETDDTGFLNNDEHSKYRMLIGCGQWSIAMGRLDVHFAIQIIIDIGKRVVNDATDVDVNWDEQYPGAREVLPDDMPTPKGKKVNLTLYVDADHAHDQLTRRSVTGILLFINNTPIKWYSKRQILWNHQLMEQSLLP